MGVYAQTDIEIICKNNQSAQKVADEIKRKQKEDNDQHGNYDYSNLEIKDDCVFLFKASGRIQNLEYQCQNLIVLIFG